MENSSNLLSRKFYVLFVELSPHVELSSDKIKWQSIGLSFVKCIIRQTSGASWTIVINVNILFFSSCVINRSFINDIEGPLKIVAARKGKNQFRFCLYIAGTL